MAIDTLPLAIDLTQPDISQADTTDTAIRQVLTTLATTRQPRTVESYRQDLLRCGADVLACHDPVAALRALMTAGPGGCYRILSAWVGIMRARHLAQLTIHRRIAGVQAILRHLQKHGIIAWRVRLDRHDLGVAVPRRDTRGPTIDQVRRLFAAAAAQTEPIRAARDTALLWLLVGCGLRSHEARGLCVGHVDLERADIRILGKGRRERESVPLPAAAVGALRQWLACCDTAPDAPLFVRLDRAQGTAVRPLSGDGVNRIVHTLAEAAGLSPCWPHALRHSAITLAAQHMHGDAMAVRAFARHASLATSQRYIDDLHRQDRWRTTVNVVGNAV
jgi:integrase/recombinase XerC